MWIAWDMAGDECDSSELTHRHVTVLQHVQRITALEQFLAHAVLDGEGAGCHADRVQTAKIFDLDGGTRAGLMQTVNAVID